MQRGRQTAYLVRPLCYNFSIRTFDIQLVCSKSFNVRSWDSAVVCRILRHLRIAVSPPPKVQEHVLRCNV